MIVGRPISVKQHDKPTTEEVRLVQEKYITELTRYVYSFCCRGCSIELFIRIWDTYKDEFAKARLRELEIIE
jgi:2-acylglycerol O-acyltransferase 2